MENIVKRTSFFKSALADPEIGAVSASSGYVISDVLRRLAKNPHLIVEYGPGDGVITRAMLRVLPPDARLVVVEPNAEFLSVLGEINDSRLTVIAGKAQDLSPEQLREFKNADAVVASIPFSFLTQEERSKVISDTYELLAPNGKLIVPHQYSWLMRKPLQQKFGFVSLSFKMRNFPPCFIMEARK
jgi:phospholipid N-methyltransferase